MTYIQEGQHIYWYDPDKRERRLVGVNVDDYVAAPGASGARGNAADAGAEPREPDPEGVRSTTVRGPEPLWIDPPHIRLTARKR